jgi:predicted lipoprotein with Yx(FWY)xxD motif
MKRSLTALILLPAIGAAALGCGADPASKATAAPAVQAKAKRGATVRVSASRYGRILVDARGRTLYLFTRDRTTRSRCSGACARAWPPFLTSARPRSGGAEIAASALGTTRRRDGKRQVTYHGHPLYYYVGDDRPGVILCQAVIEFGGGWYVVAPSGAAITSR